MGDYTNLLYQFSRQVRVGIPPKNIQLAIASIDQVLAQVTDDVTLPILTLRLVRALLPLFDVSDPPSEVQLVRNLQPWVADLLQ